jgi:hypothetical protein
MDALSKGTDKVGVSLLSSEHGSTYSFRTFVSYSYLESRTVGKVRFQKLSESGIKNQFRRTVVRMMGQVLFIVLVSNCISCRYTCTFIFTLRRQRNDANTLFEYMLCVLCSEDDQYDCYALLDVLYMSITARRHNNICFHRLLKRKFFSLGFIGNSASVSLGCSETQFLVPRL